MSIAQVLFPFSALSKIQCDGFEITLTLSLTIEVCLTQLNKVILFLAFLSCNSLVVMRLLLETHDLNKFSVTLLVEFIGGELGENFVGCFHCGCNELK
jgi:hypothetical protein